MEVQTQTVTLPALSILPSSCPSMFFFQKEQHFGNYSRHVFGSAGLLLAQSRPELLDRCLVCGSEKIHQLGVDTSSWCRSSSLTRLDLLQELTVQDLRLAPF